MMDEIDRMKALSVKMVRLAVDEDYPTAMLATADALACLMVAARAEVEGALAITTKHTRETIATLVEAMAIAEASEETKH